MLEASSLTSLCFNLSCVDSPLLSAWVGLPDFPSVDEDDCRLAMPAMRSSNDGGGSSLGCLLAEKNGTGRLKCDCKACMADRGFLLCGLVLNREFDSLCVSLSGSSVGCEECDVNGVEEESFETLGGKSSMGVLLLLLAFGCIVAKGREGSGSSTRRDLGNSSF